MSESKYMQTDSHDIAAKDIVAFFDFDGTITTSDTLVFFVLYTLGIVKFLIKLPFAIPSLLLYAFKIIDNQTAKEHFLICMLGKITKRRLEIAAHKFAYHKLDKFIKPEIFAKLEYHLEHGHSVIIVSANLGIYLREWALRHNLTGVIATELKEVKGKYTGKLATPNCYGAQKVNRVLEYLKENKIKFIYSYGYGNSKGDIELLNYVDEAYWISGNEVVSWAESGIK